MFRLKIYVILTLLALISCSEETGIAEQTGTVTLMLNAAIQTNGTQSKAVITETGFPVSPQGEMSRIGLFLMNEQGNPYQKGEDNLLAEIRGTILPDNSKHYTWGYKLNDGVTKLDHLSIQNGTDFQLYGYYPWVKGATSTQVPFDLSAPVEETNQTDLLVSPVQKAKGDSFSRLQFISLSFKHTFALLEFRIKAQTGQQNLRVREIQIANNGSAAWIRNKGFVNPQTGVVTGNSAGNIRIRCDKTLTAGSDTYTQFRILVPPFVNWNYKDGDILVSFFETAGQATPTTQLKLSREQVTSAGFEGGKKYTYRLSYNNNMFQIDDWYVNGEITDDSIGK